MDYPTDFFNNLETNEQFMILECALLGINTKLIHDRPCVQIVIDHLLELEKKLDVWLNKDEPTQGKSQ